MNRIPTTCLALLVPAMLAASVAVAEVELTPTLGIRFGGSLESDFSDDTIDPAVSFGLTLDLPLAPEKWIAVLWSHQRAEYTDTELFQDEESFELDIDYLHAGGVYRPNHGKKTQPFVMATAGVTWVRPAPGGFDDAWGISGMIGGGARLVLSPRIGLRFEGRGYLTFSDMTISGICGGVGCSVRFSSGGVFQFEALGGVTFSF